ncbi:DUF2867 domain-containing protein [Ramlibacter sp.]|uniref:DUF2867 domain-containing protein n=1 Tax=Ramlibacter sp. TaxID=1917967 RepID=UPI002629836F|nr:DUF2867 domain-containing protein [Ramlibacter sp.]MDB5957466.1 hypothetical protein [Ramlibacter sp.]
MDFAECGLPATSMLDRQWVAAAYYQDSYCAPLSQPGAAVVDIFQGIFAHHPPWMKAALILRNWIVFFFGLDAAAASEVLKFQVKGSNAVGGQLGVWPILALTETELITGRDNRHLDFRLSVLKVADGANAKVVVSTVCKVHNVFGKIYLFLILPFHQWGLKKIICRAIVAGRV